MFPKIAPLFLALPLLLVSGSASAAPMNFKELRSTFALGLEVFDPMLGTFGDAADVGMGVFAETTLQFGGYFAAHIRFGSARAFTKKDFLPFDNGFQFIYFLTAPRFYVAPFRKLSLYFFIQPEIELQSLVSNTLVTITGNDNITGAAGGSIGIQFLAGIVSISGQVSCQYNWDYQAIFVGGSLSIGISSIIK